MASKGLSIRTIVGLLENKGRKPGQTLNNKWLVVVRVPTGLCFELTRGEVGRGLENSQTTKRMDPCWGLFAFFGDAECGLEMHTGWIGGVGRMLRLAFRAGALCGVLGLGAQVLREI